MIQLLFITTLIGIGALLLHLYWYLEDSYIEESRYINNYLKNTNRNAIRNNVLFNVRTINSHEVSNVYNKESVFNNEIRKVKINFNMNNFSNELINSNNKYRTKFNDKKSKNHIVSFYDVGYSDNNIA